MKAIDALILWTPNLPAYESFPRRGEIDVTTIPEPMELRVHPASVGACDRIWINTDAIGRIALMQRYIHQMIQIDNMDIMKVFEMLSKIDEFRYYPFVAIRPPP